MQETNWLNACKICDVALCETVDKLKATGLSENKACQMMATKTEDLYTGDQLRNRYRYHTGKNEKSDEIHQDEAAEAAEDAAPKKKTPASKKEEPPLFDRDGKPNKPVQETPEPIKVSPEFEALYSALQAQIDIEHTLGWVNTTRQSAVSLLKNLIHSIEN